MQEGTGIEDERDTAITEDGCAGDAGEKHVKNTVRNVRLVFEGCGFVFPADVTAAAVQQFLSGLKEPTTPPTPDPAKIPMRCPLPMGMSPSMARTPRCSCWVMRCLVRGAGAWLSVVTVGIAGSGPRSSIGVPSASMTRPRSPWPTGTRMGARVAVARTPGAMPVT